MEQWGGVPFRLGQVTRDRSEHELAARGNLAYTTPMEDHAPASVTEPISADIEGPAANPAPTNYLDCASRIVVCRAICCRMTVDLSPDDLARGTARWDSTRPHRVARGLDGYCLHLDRASRRCQIYPSRPAACRGYDCCYDSRIWDDFDLGLLNPGALKLLY